MSDSSQNPKIDTLKSISKSFDSILDKPSDEWTQKEINIYHLLQNSLEKYKIRYSLAQFKLDLRDITTNIKETEWYQASSYKKTLNWCLDQLVIKSYQHSRNSGNFKVVIRFSQAQVKLTIIKKDDDFNYLLENESNHLYKTKDLEDFENVPLIFGISPKISQSHRIKVIKDLANLFREIAMFYN